MYHRGLLAECSIAQEFQQRETLKCPSDFLTNAGDLVPKTYAGSVAGVGATGNY